MGASNPPSSGGERFDLRAIFDLPEVRRMNQRVTNRARLLRSMRMVGGILFVLGVIDLTATTVWAPGRSNASDDIGVIVLMGFSLLLILVTGLARKVTFSDVEELQLDETGVTFVHADRVQDRVLWAPPGFELELRETASPAGKEGEAIRWFILSDPRIWGFLTKSAFDALLAAARARRYRVLTEENTGGTHYTSMLISMPRKRRGPKTA